MKILLTSVGRRAYMVKYFKDELAKLPEKGQVHVCNSDSLTVAFAYADQSVVSPLIYDDEYIPFLLNYCKENKIDMVISLFDIDLLILAKNKEKFQEIGTQVIVSDPHLIEKCNDKWKTYQYLKENGFKVPKTYLTLQKTMLALDKGELKYPVIVKPRFGCGSIAMCIANDDMELLYNYSRNARSISNSYLKYESANEDEIIIFQEMLPGQEYGADIINNLDGKFENAIIKKKIAMRAGETDISETVDVPCLFNEAKRLGELTGHIGNMDCDMFLVDGKPYILEMNARFGGGYPFSHMAGVNLPKAIIDWHNGKSVEKDLLTAKTGVLTYKELTLTNVTK